MIIMSNLGTYRCSFRSSHPEVFHEKGVLKLCSKFTGEQPCRSVISIKLLCNFSEITLRRECCNFIEIALRHSCSPVNFLHIFRTPFPNDTSEGLMRNSDPNCISIKFDLSVWYIVNKFKIISNTTVIFLQTNVYFKHI